MLPTKKTVREAGGIWNEPILRSMEVACDTENVVIWAYTVQNNMVVAQIGSIPIIILTSSTSVRVDKLHLFIIILVLLAGLALSGILIAALSKKLRVQEIKKFIINKSMVV